MRKYRILVLTSNPTEAHGAVLHNTFGKRPYTKVRATVNELLLTYDDAEIQIKRYNGCSLDSVRGCRWDEVWIDEYVWDNMSEEDARLSLINYVIAYTRVYQQKQLEKEFPHYAQRQAVNYFNKSDDGHGN